MRGTAKESNAGSQSLTWTKWEWKFLNSLLWSPCTLFLCSEGSLSYSTGLCKKAKTFKVVRAFFFFFPLSLSMPGLWINTGLVWEDECFLSVGCDADRTVWKWYQHLENFFFLPLSESLLMTCFILTSQTELLAFCLSLDALASFFNAVPLDKNTSRSS